MQVAEYALFPTRLLTIEFPDTRELNEELYELLTGGAEFRDGFNMHPDALNLLRLADHAPALARVREMFLEGLRRWLRAEQVRGELTIDMVLFSNLASKGDYTLVHNHSADVVGVYYVRAPESPRGPVVLPSPGSEYDYFDAEDGALVLHDPRFNANLAAVQSTDYAKVFPRPGLMLIFPAYLWHSVTTVSSDLRRLALSANFSLRWPGADKAVPLAVRIDGP